MIYMCVELYLYCNERLDVSTGRLLGRGGKRISTRGYKYG